ncbi:MAG: hypothetical protein LBC77_00960 [Spirochaetaceae bacterium]|nr:hypothetical protein [Spirochaetaceae bacterium]
MENHLIILENDTHHFGKSPCHFIESLDNLSCPPNEAGRAHCRPKAQVVKASKTS